MPEYRRLELTRAGFHMIAATSAIIYFYLSDFTGAIVLLILGITISVADYFRTRSKIVRENLPSFMLNMVRKKEITRISAITHFIMAATIINFLYLFAGFPKAAALAATMFAAIGDPLARIAGISFGKIRLFNADKTLLGSTVFYSAGVGSAYLVGSLLRAELSLELLVSGGLLVTMVELFGGEWDNFAVPLLGSLIFWLLIVLGF